MKTKLNVFYCTNTYIGGFKFLDFTPGSDEYIFLGEIEIDNPYDTPDKTVINNAKVESINKEIVEHKAKINLLENAIKDLLCVENKSESK